MKTLLTLAALAAMQLAAAQKTQEFKDLKRITVGSDMTLTMIKGNENKLVLDKEDSFDVDYKNGSLALQGEGNATLYYKDGLESITIGSDSKVNGNEEIKGKEFQLTAGTDSEVSLKFNVQDLQVTAGSDSKVSLSGKTENMRATIGSDGKFDAQDLNVGDATINLGSDAKGTMYAKGTVNATVASDSSLKVYGNPKKVNEVKGSDAEIDIVR